LCSSKLSESWQPSSAMTSNDTSSSSSCAADSAEVLDASKVSDDATVGQTQGPESSSPSEAEVDAAARKLLEDLGVDESGAQNDEGTTSQTLDAAEVPRFYVIVHNVAKKNNIGMLMRSAGAFGVKEILVVGHRNNVQFFGAQGSLNRVRVTFLTSLQEAVDLVRAQNCHIYGIEIKDEAASVVDEPFVAGKNAAFLLGNEGIGLTAGQCRACDSFVYIPHYGDATESLNVTMAGTVIFHRFAAWAKYPEHTRSGEKFHVKSTVEKRGIANLEDARKHVVRNWKRIKLDEKASIEKAE